MKLILINSYIKKLDKYKSNADLKSLFSLQSDIYADIVKYFNKYKKEDDFTDILYHIALDVNDEIGKALEELEHNQGVQL
ncbi:hypothetical protein CPG38_06885 [Malaciobacter marinus]|uniref:hypothetical protein n=1 Tax=Malaciobacter marinus TaxID=505249 RepID=UPI000C06C687|nr:hypothetical protein [Malaciobacter marinus]PHO12567.1 hypothetical protein CPG38_06885 [Malaciobacter marinus]